MFGNLLRHNKTGIFITPIGLFGQGQLLTSQWRPMGTGSVLLVGCANTDMGAGNNQRRTRILLGPLHRGINLGQILTLNALHMPAIGQITRTNIFAEGEGGFPLDGNFIVEIQII